MTFAETQLRQMLHDRPRMSDFLSIGDSVWHYSLSKFDGVDLGIKIQWNPDDSDIPAGCISQLKLPSAKNDRAYIHIREHDCNGNPFSGEHLWSAAVFEFLNLENFKGYDHIYTKAGRGHLSRKEWIEMNTKLEFEALEKTAEFYDRVWFNSMREKQIRSNPEFWKLPKTAMTYEEWISQYNDPSGYPFSCWGKYFDQTIVPIIERLSRWMDGVTPINQKPNSGS